MEELRYYQEEAVGSIFSYFHNNCGNPIVAMPGGTGKSHVIAEFVRRAFSYYPWSRVVIATHVKELIVQNHKKLLYHWPTAPAGIYSAGLNKKEAQYPITFAGIGSIAKNAAALGRIDLLLIDECHLVSPKEDTMYQFFIEELRKVNPLLKIIGFTATGYRLGLGPLTEGGIFTDFCFDITGYEAFNTLVKEGWIAPLVSKRPSLEYDLTGVHLAGGEYKQNELQQAVDKKELTYKAIEELVMHGATRNHWILFSSGIEHAVHIGAMLDYFGIPNAVVHSKMPEKERDYAIASYKGGDVRAIVNNGILTTGFDFPPIDLVGMLRATQSASLWVQMLSRATRPWPGKDNGYVMDFAGNTRRLGPINDPVLPKKRGHKGGGLAPIRICDCCGTYNHASARVCEACGEPFPIAPKIRSHAYTDDVMKLVFPQYEIFKVNKVTYEEHRKQGKPSSIKVTYYCGLNRFREWVCLEHPEPIAHRAREWWRKRVESCIPPTNTLDALRLQNMLRIPLAIKVWINKEYPEIINYDFTGHDFEEQQDAATV